MPPRREEPHHRFRASELTGTYFVTLCTRQRATGLIASKIACDLLEVVRNSDGVQDTLTYAFTVMPDHCHWVFRLGDRLSLRQVVAKYKTQTRRVLSDAGLVWQRDYYEHRLRIREDPEDFSLYVFLNPYRGGLISVLQAWPWWWTADGKLLRFVELLTPDGGPQPEWIGWPVPAGVRDA